MVAGGDGCPNEQEKKGSFHSLVISSTLFCVFSRLRMKVHGFTYPSFLMGCLPIKQDPVGFQMESSPTSNGILSKNSGDKNTIEYLWCHQRKVFTFWGMPMTLLSKLCTKNTFIHVCSSHPIIWVNNITIVAKGRSDAFSVNTFRAAQNGEILLCWLGVEWLCRTESE